MANILRIDHANDTHNLYIQTFREILLFKNNFTKTYPSHVVFEAINSDAEAGHITNILNTTPIAFISAAGHGTPKEVRGFDGKPIWRSIDNLQQFQGRFVHCLSCHTGAQLGFEITAYGGAIAFWGYTDEFQFPTDARKAPHDDFVAEALIKMDVAIDEGILLGKTAKEIYIKLEQYVNDTYVDLLQMAETWAATLLKANFARLVGPVVRWGDEDAIL